ncbi:unnamed protein product, partial [Ectocarpus sp. 8 AP-2014]
VEETWKPTHVTHLYEVSNLGRVRKADNQFVRKLTTNPHGYNLLSLKMGGKTFTNLVGRLVLGAFDRAPIDGDKAHHIDGDRTNDMIENLEWTSIGEAGTTRSYPRSIASKPVVATSKDRKERMVFVSALEAASLFDTRRVDIYDAIGSGRSISDGVCGYTFNYDDSDKPVCEVRSVPGSDVYKVSRDGRVRMENGRWTFGVKHWQTTGDSKKDKQAYRRVDMIVTTGGTRKTKKKYVDHIDGNKSNNAVSNLEYVSKRENDRRTYANGGRKPPGEKPVLLIKQDGTFSRFKSSSEGARQMGVNVATVSINCSTGRKNRAGNYWAH